MNPKIDWPERIQLVMSFILRGALTTAVVLFAYEKNWSMLFLSGIVLIASLLPVLIERSKKLYFPIEFELVITLFVFAAVLLGEGYGFYTKIWWWDLMLHALSGIVLGFIGFLIVHLISEERNVKLPPILIAIFSFSFALALGVMWEIFEFSMDRGFGMVMQHNSLVDTMTDLIVDAIGGIFTALVGYFYVKGGDLQIMDHLVCDFVRENPILFPKSHCNPKISRKR